MVHTSRLKQIKELQAKHERWYIENAIIELNVEIIRKNKEIVDALERYVNEFIISDDFSLDYIQWLLTKLRLYKWLEIQSELGLSKMLFSLIFNTVLLPNYLDNASSEKNYKELKEIIDNYLKIFDKKIDKLNSDNYCLELWNPYEIAKETKINEANKVDLINFRMFYIWEWFWNNIFEFDEKVGNYTFKIPVNLASKANKSKRKINPEKLKKFIDTIVKEFAIKNKSNPFYISFNVEQDLDLVYWANESIPYFTTILTKDIELNNPDDVLLFLRDLIEVNNFIINEISKEFGLKINKHINLFSSWDTLVIWKNSEENTTSKFEKLKITDKKRITLADVWWQEEAKKEIETIIKMIKHEEVIDSWWAKHSKWIIFEWPSWTWKTLLAKVIANEVNAEVYNIKLTDIQSSSMINEWANNIKDLFTFIRERSKKINKKIIVILDELDALFKKRNWSVNSSWEDTKIVNTFLSEMSWFEDLEDIIFIWTTNLIDSIDEAVIRSGRMSTKIKVDLPDTKALKQIYEIHISKLPQKAREAFSEINLDEVVKKTDWLSWANIEDIINRLVTKKAMQEIDRNETSKITLSEIIEIIEKVKWISKSRTMWFLNS